MLVVCGVRCRHAFPVLCTSAVYRHKRRAGGGCTQAPVAGALVRWTQCHGTYTSGHWWWLDGVLISFLVALVKRAFL